MPRLPVPGTNRAGPESSPEAREPLWAGGNDIDAIEPIIPSGQGLSTPVLFSNKARAAARVPIGRHDCGQPPGKRLPMSAVLRGCRATASDRRFRSVEFRAKSRCESMADHGVQPRLAVAARMKEGSALRRTKPLWALPV